MIGISAFVLAFIIHHIGRPIRPDPFDHPLIFRTFPQVVPLMLIAIGICWLVVIWSILSYAYYEMTLEEIAIIFAIYFSWIICIVIITPSIIPFLSRNFSGNGSLQEWAAFFSGMALGPIGFLAMFNSVDIARGLAGARLWGAIFGTLSIYSLYGYFADGSAPPPSRGSVPQHQPALPRQSSNQAITAAPSQPARSNPTLEGFTVRAEQFGDWNFQERRDPRGNRICVIQPINNPHPAAPMLGIGWSGMSQNTHLFVNSDGPHSGAINISIDNRTFILIHDYTSIYGSNIRRHHYIFPVNAVDTFANGSIMIANGVRYSLRGSFRAYDTLVACINARP